MFKCWKFCRECCDNTLYVSTIIPSDKLVAQVLGVRVDWFEVLEVLEGERCLDHCQPVGFVVTLLSLVEVVLYYRGIDSD